MLLSRKKIETLETCVHVLNTQIIDLQAQLMDLQAKVSEVLDDRDGRPVSDEIRKFNEGVANIMNYSLETARKKGGAK